ncbi:hypothetical protein POUND7_020353 [Theobroma cacao]
MAPALSLSVSHLPVCKSQDFSKDTCLPKGTNRENPSAKIASDVKLSKRKLLSSTALGLIGGAVRKVDLFENATVAIAEIYNPALDKIQRVRVQLPGLPQELLGKMKEKGVDFAAHPIDINWSVALLDLLGNLAFPSILRGTLLLRSSSSNTPGGPNLPFGLGRTLNLLIEQVTIGIPDIRGREEILKVHSNNKRLDKDVSLGVIAMRTPGFSGADLANLMNEAAILAGRRGKDKITMKEIDDSIDRIVAGMEGTKMTDGKSKILVAYHEIGHAVCATLTPVHDPVQKVTLIPRGQARGLTWFKPGEDPALIAKQELFARIVGGLGGRAAEEIIFGESEITTGAAGDLQQITQIARQIVTRFGMSDIGPWALTDPAVQSSDVVLRMLARNSMSEKLAEDIDSSVRNIIESAYEVAKKHIRNNREAIDKRVEVLLEKETLTGDEFRTILSEFVDAPVVKADRSPVREMINA